MCITDSNFWGGTNNSKQYLMMLERDEHPYINPEELIAHSFTSFNVEQIDRVTVTTVRFDHGQIVERQKVLRPARQTAVTYTVGMGGEGEVYTPLLQQIRRQRGACELNIYIKRLCNQNDEFAHFYALLESIFNPPTFVNDLITIDDTTNVVSQQSEARASDMLLVFQLGAFVVADETPPLYCVSVRSQQCSDCVTGQFNEFFAGGGAGGVGDAAYLIRTDDRFSSVDVLTTGIATGNSVKAVYTDGDIVLAGFADTPDPTAAAAGGTIISADGGDTFTIDANLTLPVNAVGYFEGQYIAAGGAGGGQGMLWTSDDGINWTSVASGALSATKEITSIAVDTQNECFYLTGAGGLLLKGTKSGSTIQLAALAPTSVSTTYLWRVSVFGDNHIAVGGAAGYYAESLDGGSTWATPQVPGSTAVRGIAGLSHIRAMIATGSVVTDRTIMNKNQYTIRTYANAGAITGDFTDMSNGDGEYNYSIAVTDDGEIVICKPFAPDS